MGLLPVASAPSLNQIALGDLSIAAPLPLSASASTILSLKSRVTASGVLITDLSSGQILLAINPDKRRPMGSLTKLMTALLIVENHAMNEIVTVPKSVEQVSGSLAHLRPGDQYTVGDLLSALLVPSGNDAAVTLAEFHSGSQEAFTQEMNDRARTLGLQNTSYANPDGLDAPNEWSTPRDLAWLASYVLGQKQILRRMSLPETVIHSVGGRALTLQNTHLLLHEPGPVVAGKTGTTDGAGQCLLSIVREGEREYVVVLLGSHERYADMRVVLSVLATLFV
jgi:D-alanyl-D-alanine carboxypeptidase (penicillin-binding protein 5/6)